MRAKKLKIYIKTEKFLFPIPALRFSTLRWLSKMATRWIPKSGKNKRTQTDNYLKYLSGEDIDRLIVQLEQEEPFEMVNIETYNEKEGKVIVKVYTL